MVGRVVRVFLITLMAIGFVGQSARSPHTSAASALHFLYGSGSQTGGKNIHLRVELTDPAPSGGVNVTLTANNGAINVPPTVHVNTATTDKTVTVTTDPVAVDT